MNIEYAVVSEQGPREEMEDAHCLRRPFCGDEQTLFAGVFDGHGSLLKAEQVAESIPMTFSQQLGRYTSVRRAFRESYRVASGSIMD